MPQLIHEDISYGIIGGCMRVHTFLGHGFLEIVYKDAMQIEFAESEIDFTREKEFDINYKGIILPHKFYADFFVMGSVIVEAKATKDGISNDFIAQTLYYMKVSGCSLGLIVNFGKSNLEFKRLVL
ncbi:MAG: GxxExxY protein [Ferruginibacter sp.]|nr:GxxExxY protein [Chitinophagaceae bacterium]